MISTTKVTVKPGRIVGGVNILPNGNTYNFFKGIPYAEPPLGKLRFQAPIPLERFVAPEIECTKEGNVCFQRDKTGKYIGSEDCLFLNVYSPKINSKEGLPVMVFIPGGAFVTGSGNSENYNPLYLVQENVVVVTMNYRLGPLGFISLPQGNISGNAGLKDQRLALEWVQENISQFGGDPNNVTLFGQSAGSLSVHMHVLSERSRKLFHKAIMQSGVVNMSFLIEDRAAFKTMELAKTLGCSSNDPSDVAEFLQQYQDLERMCEPLYAAMTLELLFTGPPVPARPVFEEDSPEAVFTKKSLESFNDKNSIDMPMIIGCNSADGSAVLPALIGKLEHLKNNLRSFLPGGKGNLEIFNDLELPIKELYFKELNIDNSTLNELSVFLSDVLFIVHIIEFVEQSSRMQHKSPLYFYVFDYDGDLNLHKKKYKLENIIKGAGHSDELCYIFQPNSAPEPWNEKEMKMVKNICKMWTNFAKSNDPTLGCDWMPVRKINNEDDFSLDAYIIDGRERMVENPYKERLDFWRKLRETVNDLLNTSRKT